LKIPDQGRQLTKASLRKELADAWADKQRLHQEALDSFRMLSLSVTVKALDSVFARLSKPKL
jgi:hypothetical protein